MTSTFNRLPASRCREHRTARGAEPMARAAALGWLVRASLRQQCAAEEDRGQGHAAYCPACREPSRLHFMLSTPPPTAFVLAPCAHGSLIVNVNDRAGEGDSSFG